MSKEQNDEKLRQQCLEVLQTAPTSTLHMLATYLQSAKRAKKGSIRSIIHWHNDGIIYDPLFIQDDWESIDGLFSFVWRNMIIAICFRNGQKHGETKNIAWLLGLNRWLDDSKNHPAYLLSPCREEFESLCLNGCGQSRKAAMAGRPQSEYCGDDCREALNRWLHLQSKCLWADLLENLRQRVDKLTRSLAE